MIYSRKTVGRVFEKKEEGREKKSCSLAAAIDQSAVRVYIRAHYIERAWVQSKSAKCQVGGGRLRKKLAQAVSMD